MSTSTADIGSGDRLSFTVFIAVILHALIVFGITFTRDSGTKVAPTLNITLATHDTKKPPEKADFLAQHNQEASGTIQEVKELTVKEQAKIHDVKIRDVNPIPQQKQSKKQDAESRVVITKKRSTHLVTQQKHKDDKDEIHREKEGEDLDTPIVNPEFASLQAKLDRERQAYAKIPRIRRLTSVSTKKAYDAKYLHDWAQKIERIGNENFPESALRDEIFGDLRLSVLIMPNGMVDNIEILQSSGHSILDEAAMHIVKLAAPFSSFPREIRKNTDKLEIIRTWRFEITGLKTTR